MLTNLYLHFSTVGTIPVHNKFLRRIRISDIASLGTVGTSVPMVWYPRSFDFSQTEKSDQRSDSSTIRTFLSC